MPGDFDGAHFAVPDSALVQLSKLHDFRARILILEKNL